MNHSEQVGVPAEYRDGYLRLEDYGLIGDGATAALVGRDGAVSWMCVPAFDSPPIFCSLLDAQRGGAFQVRPEILLSSRQYYEEDTAVLVTEMQGPSGLLRVTDACILNPGADLAKDIATDRGELQRNLEVIQGRVRVQISLHPFGRCKFEPRAGGTRIRIHDRQDLDLQVWSERPLAGGETEWVMVEGERSLISLCWKEKRFHHHETSGEEKLDHTRRAWRTWSKCIRYQGPENGMVRRSALTLKLLDYFQNGAMVAAPTSSLPEWIGGARNWDYRYTWIRDAAFAVYALRRIGMGHEAGGFLGWVLDAVEEDMRPRVLYSLDGSKAPPEIEDRELKGYRGSRPVRWGNAAAHQRQHDVFGQVLDCAFQWIRKGGEIEERLWRKLSDFADTSLEEWDRPDRGIWEVRTAGRPFTYSAALCQVALDRAARIADYKNLPGPVERWRKGAEHIREKILDLAWDPRLNSLTQHLGGGGLDSSILALPLRRVVDARHPRMIATTRAVSDRLSAGGGLLYRYLPYESPDGVNGQEGAFVLCSFWLVENLILQGKIEQAESLFESLCRRSNPLGLLPEQIDPATGAFLGNYPQAMSHVGLIACAVRFSRIRR